MQTRWRYPISESIFADELSNCEGSLTNHYQYSHDTAFLKFASPNVNDTGEYVCTRGSDDPGTTIYVAVGNY